MPKHRLDPCLDERLDRVSADLVGVVGQDLHAAHGFIQATIGLNGRLRHVSRDFIEVHIRPVLLLIRRAGHVRSVDDLHILIRIRQQRDATGNVPGQRTNIDLSIPAHEITLVHRELDVINALVGDLVRQSLHIAHQMDFALRVVAVRLDYRLAQDKRAASVGILSR